jgi:hypothetical protein
MTNGCPGCRAANQGGKSVNHNETCRTRFSQKMTEQKDPRIQRDQEKFRGMEEDDTASFVPEIEQDDKDSVIEEEEEVPAEDEDMGMEYMVQNVPNQKWMKSDKYGGQISDVAKQETMYWDDMSGEPLLSSEVQRARMEEMEEFKKHQVYKKVPIQKCWDETGKGPIGVRWVDINKGDKVNPEYRSRLVAKEIKLYKTLDLFAATPP